MVPNETVNRGCLGRNSNSDVLVVWLILVPSSINCTIASHLMHLWNLHRGRFNMHSYACVLFRLQ